MASSSSNKSPVMPDRHTPAFRSRVGTVDETISIWELGTEQTDTGAIISGSIIESVSAICTGTGNSGPCTLEFLLVRGQNTGDAVRLGRLDVPETQTDSMLDFPLPPILTPTPEVGTEAKNRGLYIPPGFGLYVHPLGIITGPGIDILAQVAIN